MSQVIHLEAGMLTQLAAPRHRPVRPASPAVLSLPLSCFRWVLRQLNGRTSTGARQATAALRPHASA